MLFDSIENNDNEISGITISADSLIIAITKWDGMPVNIVCNGYYGHKAFLPIGVDIGNVILKEDSSFMSELDLSDEESKKLRSLSFYSAWDDDQLLIEVVAKNFELR